MLEREPAFGTLRIHRLEAGITSDNHRKLTVVIPRTGSTMNSLPLYQQLEIRVLAAEMRKQHIRSKKYPRRVISTIQLEKCIAGLVSAGDEAGDKAKAGAGHEAGAAQALYSSGNAFCSSIKGVIAF